MENFMDILEIIANNGMSVAIIVYFLFKDYRFNEHITNVLGEIKEVLTVLKETIPK